MVKLLNYPENWKEIIERASRMSTNTKTSFDGIDELDPIEDKVEIDLIKREAERKSGEFIKKLVKRGHLSIGRFVYVEFEVECSRTALAQWTRHAFLNFCVMSQRYVNQQEVESIIPGLDYLKTTYEVKNVEIEDGLPLKIAERADIVENCQEKALKLIAENIFRSKEAYNELINLGVKKEDARYILPEATKTKFVVG